MRHLLLLGLNLPATAHAAPGDIIVTGRALPAARSDAAYDLVEIDRARLATTASARIEDALRDVAGLQQFRRTDARSANATSQGATLRGLGGNASSRALLLLDGVPQSDPFGGWVSWPAFANERLSAVRVTRGGGSGIFGAGALAGTIELASLGPDDIGGVRGALALGSRSSVDASLVAGGALGGGFASIGANFARGDGFVPIIAAQRGPADRAAPYRQASLGARAVVPLGAGELQASLMGFSDRRTRGTILSDNGGDGADASLRYVSHGAWRWEALAYLQLRRFMSCAVSVDAARASVLQTLDQYNVPSTGAGARFELRPPLGAGLELRLGGDARRVTGETREFFTYVGGAPTRSRIAGGSSVTLGGFGELTAQLGALTLTGAARLDHWQIGQGALLERTIASGGLLRNDRAAARDGWQPTLRAGAALETGTLRWRVSAYQGWRLPTLNELYRPFRIGADATAANPALTPETLRGAELGLDWQMADGAGLALTLFANRLDDAIANVSLGSGPGNFAGVGFVGAGGTYRQRRNVDHISSQGVEIDGHARLGALRLHASYAFSDARVHAPGLGLDALRPAQVPRHLASATLGWRWLTTSLRYVSQQYEDDANRRALRNAVTLDAALRLPLGDRLLVELRGENLGDAQVDAAISGSGVIERATPRTLWIGLRWGG